MARKKTKKQKIKAKKRIIGSTRVKVSEDGGVSISVENQKKIKTKATTFSQSQVSLVKRDLLKTLITSIIVFGVLIAVYLSS